MNSLRRTLLVLSLIICLCLAGCSETDKQSSHIEKDLQTISNCRFVQCDNGYYRIFKDGLYKSESYPFSWQRIIEGSCVSLSCSDDYIYCIKIVPCNDDPDYNEHYLVRYRMSDLEECTIAKHVSLYTFLDDKIVYQYAPDWDYTKKHTSLRNHYGSLYSVSTNGSGKKLIVDKSVYDFWTFEGKLWYTVHAEHASEQRFIDFFTYDLQDGAETYMGSSAHSICGSYNNFVFGQAYQEDPPAVKLAVLNINDFSETIVDVNGSVENAIFYVFPAKFKDSFENDAITYSCDEYVVIGVNSKTQRPYIVNDHIEWFGDDWFREGHSYCLSATEEGSKLLKTS